MYVAVQHFHLQYPARTRRAARCYHPRARRSEEPHVSASLTMSKALCRAREWAADHLKRLGLVEAEVDANNSEASGRRRGASAADDPLTAVSALSAEDGASDSRRLYDGRSVGHPSCSTGSSQKRAIGHPTATKSKRARSVVSMDDARTMENLKGR